MAIQCVNAHGKLLKIPHDQWGGSSLENQLQMGDISVPRLMTGGALSHCLVCQ